MFYEVSLAQKFAQQAPQKPKDPKNRSKFKGSNENECCLATQIDPKKFLSITPAPK